MHLRLEITDQEVELIHSEDIGPDTLVYMLAAVQNKIINDTLDDSKDQVILKIAEILKRDTRESKPKRYDPDDFSARGIF